MQVQVKTSQWKCNTMDMKQSGQNADELRASPKQADLKKLGSYAGTKAISVSPGLPVT
jgi:hypothetical protein